MHQIRKHQNVQTNHSYLNPLSGNDVHARQAPQRS